jgi:uncharacterized protein
MLAHHIPAARLAELVTQEASLAVDVRCADLPRLAEIAARGAAVSELPVRVRVRFRAGAEGFPLVCIEAQGAISLVCQRCLAPVDYPLDIRANLTAIADEPRTAELASPFDSILLDTDGGLPLMAVVEDEIISALPLAPRHLRAADCRSDVVKRDVWAPGESVSRPFAGLAGLRKPGPNDENQL